MAYGLKACSCHPLKRMVYLCQIGENVDVNAIRNVHWLFVTEARLYKKSVTMFRVDLHVERYI